MFKKVSANAFKMISQLDVVSLLGLPQGEVRPLLPSLVRMSLCSSMDTSDEWQDKRKFLLQLLSGMDAVNDIIALLSVDFHELEKDAQKEQQTRVKMGNANATESVLVSGLKQQGVLLEFERSEPSRRFRIVISEILPVVMQVESHGAGSGSLNSTPESELFACEAYLQDVSDVVCILCAELPSLLPLSIISEALLYFPNGIVVLQKLIANNPESLIPVCHSLLGIQANQLSASQEIRNSILDEKLRCDALIALCSMHPEYALTVRKLCVQHCQLPELAVTLTLNHASSFQLVIEKQSTETKAKSVSDLVAFVCGLLLGNDSRVRSWFATYVRHTKDSADNRLRGELVKELQAVVKTAEVKSDMKSSEQSIPAGDTALVIEGSMYLLLDEHCLRAAALIRLYCALKAIAGIKFTSEESDLLLRLITCFPPLTPTGIRFVSLALGMLLACPALLTGQAQEQQVISWVKWLASRSSEMETVGPEGCSFAEQLLLTAIHLHGDRQSAAVRLACSTLGMRIKVNSSSLSKLRQIFTEEVFPTQVVAAHSTKIPVTKKLNASMVGYLPVHCIYQLLKTRSFSQGRVPVKDWIYKQICSAASPLHPQLQPLIMQYVTTVVTPATKGHRHDGALNEPLTETQILDVYGIKQSGDKKETSFIDTTSEYSLTSRLLMLYYVLLFEDSILNNMKTLALLSNRPERYSSSLINQIPVKFLLYKAQRHPKSCQGLYPALLGLLTTHLPHLCMVEDWMQDLDYLLPTSMIPSTSLQRKDAANRKTTDEKLQLTPTQLHDGLQRSIVNPAPALMHLRALSHPQVPADDVIPYVNALTLGLPFIIDDKVSRRVRQEAQKLWLKINSVIPRKLWVLTVNALQSTSIAANTQSLSSSVPCNISFDDLMDDPLLPLTVDARVLRCPELLAIMLRVLSACLSASRSQASALLRANPSLETKPSVPTRSISPLGNNAVTEAEKEELRVALNAAQNSAAVQLLIEICMLSDRKEESSGGNQGKAVEPSLNLLTYKREVQCLVCSTLHQMFIEDPNVAKLVHFQGYPSELVSVLVAGVPSMHICLDFVPELLQQSQSSQQLFGLELASQLCLQYPLPKSLSIARLCVNSVATLITVIPASERCAYFSRAITALPNFANAFPPLVRECVSVLQQLARVCHAYIAAHHPHISSDYVASHEDWSSETATAFTLSLKTSENKPVDPHVNLYQGVRLTFYKIVQANVS